LDKDILINIEHNRGYSIETILENAPEELWEACPSSFDEKHLNSIVGREINKIVEHCRICGEKVIRKDHWFRVLDKEKIEGILGYKLQIKHEHHTSYNPEVTITVCDSCHAKIHHS
jgi:hypothetical protein